MELSEEEKKAIKKIKKLLYMFPESEELKLLLNLVDKQEKEIEREKQYSDFYEDLCNKQQKIIKELQKDKKVLIKNYDRVLGTFISKNKIRQKIKEVQETMCPNCCACGLCDEFKELLEEN